MKRADWEAVLVFLVGTGVVVGFMLMAERAGIRPAGGAGMADFQEWMRRARAAQDAVNRLGAGAPLDEVQREAQEQLVRQEAQEQLVRQGLAEVEVATRVLQQSLEELRAKVAATQVLVDSLRELEAARRAGGR